MKDLIKTLAAWDGAVRGDARHKQIVDAYNSYLPHPRGYALTVKDDYCAATVSAAAILCGLTDAIPVECSCGEQMRWYQARGQWVEADDHMPQVGEQVFYCWTDGSDYAKTDNTGIVTAVQGSTFDVFEGNMGTAHKCGTRRMAVNGRYIRGFGRPAYPTERAAPGVVKLGDKSKAVGKLQEFLRACGYALDMDHSFGPATQRAWGEYLAAWIRESTK